MKEYIKNIISEKDELIQEEWQVLRHKENLPRLTKAGEILPPLQEVFVKALYLTGGMFLKDIQKMAAFHSDIQKTERALKALVKDGYLQAQTTTVGTFYTVTAEGVKVIRYGLGGTLKSVSVTNIEGESSLLKRKVISNLIADFVFQRQVTELRESFYATDKVERNLYLLKLYLKNIIYRETKPKTYQPKEAEAFVEQLLKEVGKEKLKAEEQYHRYIVFIKEHCLKSADENTFYLLKGMRTEKSSEYRILAILYSWKCNLLKYGMFSIWEVMEEELKKNPLFYKEQQLETCNRYLKYLGDERKSLIQKNAYKKKQESEELERIIEKLNVLEPCMERLRKEKESLETEFSFPVLRAYDEDGNDVEERVITFKRLEQQGIYMERSWENVLTFYLLQTSEEGWDLFTLHKKVSMLYQLVRRIFPLYQLRIKVVCRNEDVKRMTEGRIPALKKKLLVSRETAFLGNMMDEILEIKNLGNNIEEPYRFFHFLYDELKGECVDGTAGKGNE